MLGNPLRMILTAGQVHEATQAIALVQDMPLLSVIADKAFDTDIFRTHLAEAEAEAVIPPMVRRKALLSFDAETYKLRHRIECFINKIKHYRRIATRFDKTATSFYALLCLAAAMIWLR
jgi:transposase